MEKLIPFINNVALLMALSIPGRYLLRKFKGDDKAFQALTGLLFGGAAIVGMMYPMNFTEGVFFDARSVLASIAGLYGGAAAAIVFSIVTVSFRIHLGGDGAFTGTAVIVTSALIGLAFRLARKSKTAPPEIPELLLLGVVVHIFMLAWMRTLPSIYTLSLYKVIALPVMTVFPAGTAFIGKLLSDVIGQKSAEDKLRESEEKYRVYIDNAPEGVFVVDDAGKYIDANPAALAMSGYSLDELKRMSIPDLLHPDSLAEGATQFESLLKTGKSLGEAKCVRKDGSAFIMRINAVSIAKNKHIAFCVDITDKIRNEQALRLSESKFKTYFDMQTIGIATTTAEIEWDEINDAFADMFGYSREEMSRIKWGDLAHPEDLPTIEEKFDLLRSGEIHSFAADARFIRKDGSTLWATMSAGAARNADGEAERFISALLDITEKIEAQRALVQRENLLQMALSGSKMGVWEWDVLSGKTASDQNSMNIIGYMPGEAGSSIDWLWKNTHPDDLNRVAKELQENIVGGTDMFEFEYRVKAKSGEWKWLLDRAKIVERNEKGAPLKMTGTHIDITERKNAEERLKQSEYMYRMLFDNAGDAIFIHDAKEGKMLAVNAMAVENYGFSFEELMRMSPSMLDTPEQSARVPERIAAISKKGSLKFETAHILKDGSVIPVDVNSRLINWMGEPAIMSVCRDISARKRSEELTITLMEKDKLASVGRIAGKMAHDFNNVLGIVMGTAELLLSGELPSDVRNDVRVILESSERGRDLTKNLLLFARDQEPKMKKFDLNEKVEMLVKSLRADLRGIEVSADYGSGLESLVADAGLLENALINLFQNAVHAMSKTEKPILKIKTYGLGDEVFIEISDNGCGIPDEYKEKIFEPAFTMKGSGDRLGCYRRDIKGSGYGMTNVKRCIEKHGGKIRFESELGKGSSFTVSLPLIKAHLTEEELESIRNEDIQRNKRLLIVEDEPQLGRILYSVMGKFNHSIDLAVDGAMAIDHVKHNVYDLISLDYLLPDGNGFEVYKKIREKNIDVPVVFVSGNFEFMQSVSDLKKKDPNLDHLSKPFSNLEYFRLMNKWLTPKSD